MNLDHELLRKFEEGLDPIKPEDSKVKAAIVGYGEMSTIFRIEGDDSIAYKRMPLFESREQAELYDGLYLEYCDLLVEAGISLPKSETSIVVIPERPVVLYIAQEMLPPPRFAHRLIHSQDMNANKHLMELVLENSKKLWRFCALRDDGLEIAADGQLSNWVHPDDGTDTLIYIDTSTPFVKKSGVHQLDAEIVLKSTPGLLRRFIKDEVAREVMDRYYDPRKNMIDLVGNLIKEQKPELIMPFIEIINQHLPEESEPVTLKAVKSYYREDKAIWALFLRLRQIDRWITSKIKRKRYEYILPGKIKR
jgi:uncharacterized protein DUF6206